MDERPNLPTFKEMLTMGRVKGMLMDLILGKPDLFAPLGSSELGDMLEFLQDQRNEIEVLITHCRQHYQKATIVEAADILRGTRNYEDQI